MKPKTQFTLNIVGLTVLLIGGLTLAIMMGVMMAVDELPSTERIILLLLGLAIAGFCLARIFKLNKAEENRRVGKVVNEQHEFVAHWEIAPLVWRSFVDQRLIWEKKEANGTGLAFGIVLAVVAGLITIPNQPLLEAGAITGGVFLIGYVLGLLGTRKTAMNRFHQDTAFEGCEVFFAEKLIVVNGRLVQVSDFGVRPLEVRLEEKFGMTVLTLKIQTGWGNRKSVKWHQIPVPEGEVEKANAMCRQYTSLI